MYLITNTRLHVLGNEIHDIKSNKLELHSQRTRPMVYVFEDYHDCKRFSKVMCFKKHGAIGNTNIMNVANTQKTNDTFDVFTKSCYKIKLSEKLLTEYEAYNVTSIEEKMADDIQYLMVVQNSALFIVKEYALSDANWLSVQGVILTPRFPEDMTNARLCDNIKLFLDA